MQNDHACGSCCLAVVVMVVVGIDPGLTGAIAFIKNGVPMDIVDMPVEQVEGKDARVQHRVAGLSLFYLLKDAPYDAMVVYVERVSARPSIGTRPQGAASTFSLGDSFGAVRTAVQCAKLPLHFVTPQSWKRAVGIYGADKDVSRTRATALMPQGTHYWSRKKDHGRAEAALIAWYGWMQQSSSA
ncbi:MAG: hypothetical protein NZ553_10760 [Caldilinea sp.]|nr:hypothetical protein [Caldilinea sp.]MDW8440943.1 hypothetical protein [Caldilineaceae bacterium]